MIEKVLLILAFARTSLATTHAVNCTLMTLDATPIEFATLTIQNKTTAADNKAVEAIIKFKDADAATKYDKQIDETGLQLGITETKPDDQKTDKNALTAIAGLAVKLTKSSSQMVKEEMAETTDNKDKLYKMKGTYAIVSLPQTGKGTSAKYDLKINKHAMCELKEIKAAAKTDSGVNSLLNQRSASLL